MKQIGLAYRQWAIDNNDRLPHQVSIANGGAKEWIEAGAVYTSFLVMSNELNTPQILICPQEANPKRARAATFASSVIGQTIPFTNNNNVSYFVGLDADEREPQRILSGDDNFLVDGVKPKPGLLSLQTNTTVAWIKDRHVTFGNVALADGSVLGLTTPLLRKALANSGLSTNRLAMP